MRLVAESLECRRGARSLFAPVSFALDPGAALLLRGPNGAGKTTLLRALAGLGPLAAGRVSYDGHDLAAQDGVVAYAGHLDAVKPALSVAENLDFWAAMGGTASIAPALERFALRDLVDRPAGWLSAGQKRRLGLGRLAVSPAPVWLLDEPTVSLDAENTAALGEMLTAHLEAGGIAIIATHLPIPVEAESLRLERAPETAAAMDPFLSDAPA